MHKLFPSQLENETIHLVVREHWIRLSMRIVLWGLFAAVVPLFNLYAEDLVPALTSGDFGIFIKLLLALYSMLLLLALFLIWMHYYLNVQIVTNLRIVDIDQVGLFSHVISELHIENIEDVTSETNGILGNVFNYGMVFVQTAGSRERFEFNNVPEPSHINKLLLDLYEQAPKGNND